MRWVNRYIIVTIAPLQSVSKHDGVKIRNEVKLSNKTRHRLSMSRDDIKRMLTDDLSFLFSLSLSLLNPRIFPLIFTKISLNSLKRNESTFFINLSFLQSRKKNYRWKIEKSIYKIIILISRLFSIISLFLSLQFYQIKY